MNQALAFFLCNFQTYILNKLIKQAAYTLSLESEDITKFKQLQISELKSPREREAFNIYQSYYDFMENASCVAFITKVFNILTENSFKLIETDNDRITISIILLKSFTKKNFFIFEKNKFTNSDEIFNYVQDQFKNYIIFKKQFIPEKKIWTFSVHILDLLVKYDLIEQSIIHLSGIKYKTLKYYKIKGVSYSKSITDIFDFSYIEFDIQIHNNINYIVGGHYSKIFELYKKNFYSNKRFEVKKKEYLKEKINLKLFVDEEYLNELKNSLDLDIDKIKMDIDKKNEQIAEHFDNRNWTNLTKKKIEILQSDISSLTNKIIEFSFASFNFDFRAYIIFPLFMDFRGRKYYASKIGPTNSKILRLAYYYGTYVNADFSEKSNKYSLKYYDLINNFCIQEGLTNQQKFYETYYWCLIGIGKNFINKNSFPIKEEEFLFEGVNNFKNLTNLDLEDKLEINHYKRIMRSCEETVIKKRAIIKDATASINQIFMKKLGPVDQNSMNYVNLGNLNEWYDTYTVCKEKFRDQLIRNNNQFGTNLEFDKVFPRKLIKNTIMIVPYSAGWELCWNNYVLAIKENSLDIKIDKNLKKIFKEFYRFIKEDFQSFLYIKSSDNLVEEMVENFEALRTYVLKSDTGIADISYYKLIEKSIEKKYFIKDIKEKMERITKLIKEISDAIDIESFNVASGANYAHFNDADELRQIEILLDYCIITIHDSFLIDFKNCSNLIDIKISIYQKEIDKFEKNFEIKNIFISL